MRFSWLLLFAPLLLAGCPSQPASNAPPAANRRLKVVVTTAMVADLVQHVAGEHADVTSLMGEGIDPHLFRATFQDLDKMLSADVVFYSGLTLEGAMQTALERVKNQNQVVAAVTDAIPRESLRNPDPHGSHPDPHVWHDVGLWSKCLDPIVKVLSEKDPPHADLYRQNAEAYRAQLQEVNDYAKQRIATIPESTRFLVTAHDAFAYFSRTYGIQEKAVQGITTESEAGIADINNLIDFLVSRKVPALFMEVTVNRAALDAVIEGAKKRGWEVKEGGILYSDSMGTPGSYEGTYIGMIDHNVTTITRALGGEAPEQGMAGKLKK